ncbi:DNA polymerase III subunit delta' [Acidithiobacillus sp.]|uniref:DNA polymerase III subunit delta' n=1 Tax=Acidithiobacillus sp. TaxID=1872118 RepID=UPI0025BC2312|nr:DNA polymerase III subunit delta' [Acidithiobacillus sp.]
MVEPVALPIAYARHGQLLRQMLARGLPQSMLAQGHPDSFLPKILEDFEAAALCLEPGSDQSACGRCRSCRLLMHGQHPDYRRVASLEDKDIGIDAVREALEFLSYRPQLGSRRWLRVDSAERLTLAAANALLKGLEEPAPLAHLLLSSIAPARLLPTIRSRCLRLPAMPKDLPACRAWLVEQGVPEAEASQLIQFCGDRPLLAIRLHAQDWLGQRRAALEKLLELRRRPQPQVLFRLVDQWSKSELLPSYRELMLSIYGDMLALLQGLDKIRNVDYIQGLRDAATHWSVSQIWTELQGWLSLEQEQRQHLQIQYVLEDRLWHWASNGQGGGHGRHG